MSNSWPHSPKVISEKTSLPLRPFADTKAAGALALEFSVRRLEAAIDVAFKLEGAESLYFPKPARAPERRDELWKRTCLEIFVGPADASAYLEMNLSPSGDWNVYAFDGYREGMRPADAEVVLARSTEGQWLRAATVRGPDVTKLLGCGDLVMSATSVLEYSNGEREYWALAHAGQKPDFHLRQSFVLKI